MTELLICGFVGVEEGWLADEVEEDVLCLCVLVLHLFSSSSSSQSSSFSFESSW